MLVLGHRVKLAQAMELGADAVSIKYCCSSIKEAHAQMASAMKLGVEAGRLGYLAGRMEKKALCKCKFTFRSN
jgi:thiazole synthase